MALGAYYRSVNSRAIAEPEPQLGGLGTQDQFAVQALREILESSAIKPAAVVAPWAVQDGSVDWRSQLPDHNLMLYPVNDAHMREVERSTFGTPLPAVGILTTTPVVLTKAEESFDDTPYGFDQVEAVYRLDDQKAVPTIYFLYWGRHREPSDAGGGNSSLQSASSMLGGTLVFPLELARTGQERPHPAVGFELALSTQLGQQPSAALPASAALVPAPATAKKVPWWIWTAVGGVAAYGGYRWWKGRKAG